MDLQDYTKSAIRTESTIDELKVNGQILINTLSLFISAGQMLDQVKKHTFYQKPYTDEFTSAFITAQDALNGMSGADLNVHEDVYEVDTRVFHAIIGIATESTELCEALFKVLLSKDDFDVVNLLEENGDINWYQAIMMDALGGDWAAILNNNIKKLRERFPDKFTNEAANNRDLDAEREILEDVFPCHLNKDAR